MSRRRCDRALAVGGAGWRARFLATVPSNIKNPQWLADQAVAARRGDRPALQGLGRRQTSRPTASAASSASARPPATPPRLIALEYTPAKGARKAPHVVLVGKGITFDTGGLSIKPAESMVNMKRDMTGGAVVMAVMAALAAVGLPGPGHRPGGRRRERRRRQRAAPR